VGAYETWVIAIKSQNPHFSLVNCALSFGVQPGMFVSYLLAEIGV
jgi:hypothetical protein